MDKVRFHFSRFSLTGLVIVFFASGAIAQSVSPRMHDPISPSERSFVMNIAKQKSREVSGSLFQRLAVAVGVAEPQEPVFLLMEREDAKGSLMSGNRIANTFYYDYEADELMQLSIDLRTNKVASTQTFKGVQLPLVGSEIDRAFDLVLSNSSFRQDLAQAYNSVTGAVFSGRQDVNYKAFVFHADSVAGGLATAGVSCGIERCAQLLIYTKDNFSLEFAPLVNLSTGNVVQNLERRLTSIPRPAPNYQNPLGLQPWEDRNAAHSHSGQ